MFNIKYKGNFVSDDQLIKGKSIPENAKEFGIISDLTKELGRGFIMALPIFIIMVIMTYLKIKNIDFHLKMNLDTIISFLIIIISVHILTIVHEIIHALFYPFKYEKEIWISKDKGVRFVYCGEIISRTRYIVMALAPMFILGIIPFTIWFISPNIIPMPYNIAVAVIFWLMTIVAMGDIANIYYVIKEVPKKAKVFNYGLLRSFYIEE